MAFNIQHDYLISGSEYNNIIDWLAYKQQKFRYQSSED